MINMITMISDMKKNIIEFWQDLQDEQD